MQHLLSQNAFHFEIQEVQSIRYMVLIIRHFLPIDNFDLEATYSSSVVSSSFQSEHRDAWPALSQLSTPGRDLSVSHHGNLADDSIRGRHWSGVSHAGSDVSCGSELSEIIPATQVLVVDILPPLHAAWK